MGRKGISEIIGTILMLMITIGLSGTAYLFITQAYTTGSQGLDIVDAFCNVGTTSNATLILRNIGSIPVDTGAITVTRVYPIGPAAPLWNTISVAPGTTVTMTDICQGHGSRNCIYRIAPPVGRSIVASISCLS